LQTRAPRASHPGIPAAIAARFAPRHPRHLRTGRITCWITRPPGCQRS